MKKVVIIGGTGFIGRSLSDHLSQNGYDPIIIARNPPRPAMPFEFIQWDASQLGPWTISLEGALAVVNLAGRTVDCIKTPDNIDTILRSRIDSTKVLGQALVNLDRPPSVWIQMSTAHIYGDPPSKWCTESATFGYGLAPFVGKAWEEALLAHLPNGMREVRLRTSFVIGRKGGALQTLVRLARLGLGGKVGSGTQGISWIHEYDLNEMIRIAIEHSTYEGAYIASAPQPVSNAEFMRQLRRQLKVPIGLPSPAWLTRLGAHYLFRTDPELALYGRYVVSERLENEGFVFQFPELATALEDLLPRKPLRK